MNCMSTVYMVTAHMLTLHLPCLPQARLLPSPPLLYNGDMVLQIDSNEQARAGEWNMTQVGAGEGAARLHCHTRLLLSSYICSIART